MTRDYWDDNTRDDQGWVGMTGITRDDCDD